MADCFLGVDVGTSSVRAIAVDVSGQIIGSAIRPIQIHNPQTDFYEQSSEQIWQACCLSVCAQTRFKFEGGHMDKKPQATAKAAANKRKVQQVLKENNLTNNRVKSIGFDATCSLVILDKKGIPLSTNPVVSANSPIWNVIMWMDHRAKQQANQINKSNHECLRAVGGKISLEMQPPKLLWLKENKPDIYSTAGHFMDLADYLTYKATTSLSRSLCCVVCKWMYQVTENGSGWDASFYRSIGLSDLCENNFEKIGSVVNKPGTPCASGLSQDAAKNLGLLAGTPVASGMIDAHAGCLGMLHTKLGNDEEENFENLLVTSKLSMICGTSTCHMAMSNKPLYINGVWGPYFEAVWPGLYLNEAGQSAVGPVLDTVLKQYSYLFDLNEDKFEDHYERIGQKLVEYESRHGYLEMVRLTRDLHVWPDYHGNRSPLADPTMTGAVLGQKLASDVDKETYLIAVYLAHVQSMALMTRYIMETMLKEGHNFQAIYLCGGLQKNRYYVKAHADVLQMPVVIPDDSEPVARGAAILGAFASGYFPSLEEAAKALSPSGKIERSNVELKDYFNRKYLIFRQLGDLMTNIKKY